MSVDTHPSDAAAAEPASVAASVPSDAEVPPAPARSPGLIEVVEGGAATTVQDHPGRIGYWHVGVPPNGPMDDLSHRLVNIVLGNAPGAAALEVTRLGPTLSFPM